LDALPDEIMARHRLTLEAFVTRARRIAAHSLLSDLQQFMKWSLGTVHAELGPKSGQAFVELPPEEAFESLASRCRPLLLNRELIHFPKVLGALAAFDRENPELLRQLKVLRTGWQRALNPEAPIQMGITSEATAQPTHLLTHVKIADGWLLTADTRFCPETAM
jgi:hypothetical protein